MTSDELDQLGSDVCALRFAQDHADARKLLRSIEINALREALVIVDKTTSDCDGTNAMNALERRIMELELK